MPWYNACAVHDLPEGTCFNADLGGENILLVNVDGELHAMSNICSHDYAELHEGELEGGEVICPLHLARFDVRTGAALSPPAYEDLPVFAVRVVDGDIEVEVDD
jgi:3-phenylpropionate/trans-cinnamate dioxygenase ferredoxin subunit